MSVTWPITVAIQDLLAADATLAGLSLTDTTPVVRIYNEVQEGAGYPHVVISKPTETPGHTFGGATVGLGWTNIIRIHTYSRYKGDKEALLIHQRIVTLLNFQPLTIAGYPQVSVAYVQGRPLVEDIEKIRTRHVVGEFEVMVHQ